MLEASYSEAEVDHLLLHCPIAKSVFALSRVQWVMPRRVVYLLLSWQGRFERHCDKEIWKAIPHCFMWYIWR